MIESRNTSGAAVAPRAFFLTCCVTLVFSGCMYHDAGLASLNDLARSSADEANVAATDAGRALAISRRAVENAQAAALAARNRIAAAQKTGSSSATWRATRSLKNIEREIRGAQLTTAKVDSFATLARNAAAQTRDLYSQTVACTDKIGARAHARVASSLANDARHAADAALELSEKLRTRWLAFAADSNGNE